MSKNRNVFAKRQREMEKKRKADEKRQRRARRKQADENDENDVTPNLSAAQMSPAESAVLAVFRNHGKTAGQTHHFDGANVDALQTALELLVEKELIAAEGSSGAYALTERGFEAISAETSPSDDAEP